MTEGEFSLTHVPGVGPGAVRGGQAAIVTSSWATHEILCSSDPSRIPSSRIPSPRVPSPEPQPESRIDLSSYMTFRLLLGALSSGPRVNFANAAFVE